MLRRRPAAGRSSSALGESFQNRWNTRTTAGLPQMGFNLTVGNSFNFAKKRRFGFLASLVYDYALERVVGRQPPEARHRAGRPAVGGERLQPRDRATRASSSPPSAPASLDLGVDHSLTVLTLFNRSMDDQTRYRIGTNSEVTDGPYDNWQLRFLARTLFVNQLLGDHRNLGGTRLRLRWSAFHALGQRDEPDQRVVKYGYYERQRAPLDPDRGPPLERPLADRHRRHDAASVSAVGRGVGDDRRARRGNRTAISPTGASSTRWGDADRLHRRPGDAVRNRGHRNVVRVLDFTKPNDSYAASQQGYAAFLMLETPIVGRAVGVGRRAARGVHPAGAVAEPVPRGQHAREAGDEPHGPHRHQRAARRRAQIRRQRDDAAPRRLRHDGEPPAGARAGALRLLRLPPRPEDHRQPGPQDRDHPQRSTCAGSGSSAKARSPPSPASTRSSSIRSSCRSSTR